MWKELLVSDGAEHDADSGARNNARDDAEILGRAAADQPPEETPAVRLRRSSSITSRQTAISL